MTSLYDNSNPGNDTLGGLLIKKADSAFTTMERRNIENLWSEIAEYVLPSQFAQFNGNKTKGDKKDRKLYDNTTPMATRNLASSLHSTITNPTAK